MTSKTAFRDHTASRTACALDTKVYSADYNLQLGRGDPGVPLALISAFISHSNLTM